MNNTGNIKHVFPGSNTPHGFHSMFSYILPQKDANKIYCIKGGPGTGKSFFMKRVGEYLVEQGIDVEYFHCSSDPDSLDAISAPSLKIALLDGTAPHVVDPIHPGAVDTILNFGAFWDETKIRANREQILDCTNKISRLFKKSYFYLAAAKNIYDNYLFSEEVAIDSLAKIKLEKEIISSILGKVADKGTIGYDRHLFGSAITPEGFLDYLHTIIGKSKSVYFIKETIGCNSKKLMNQLKDQAVNLGYHIECYHSPIDSDKIEDIIIPELDIAITCSNHFHKAKVFPTHIYDFGTCLVPATLKEIQNDLDRDKKLMLDLFDKGIANISAAHKLHDTLETYYISSINFSNIDTTFYTLINEIMSFAH